MKLMQRYIKIGQVGLGRNGRMHAENILCKVRNAELAAVCSVVESELEYAKSEFGVEKLYKNYNEMIKNKDLDAVVISSPTSLHCSQIIKALEAGLHVFCEKPLGMKLEECITVQKKIIKHSEKVFMIGFMRRFDDSYLYAKEKIKSGEIGKPFIVRAYGLDPMCLIDSFVNYLKASGSGGLFADMGIHDIDIARWFLGAEVESVYAVGGCYVVPEIGKYGDIDNGIATLKFKNGSIAVIYPGRTCAHGYQVETEIIGTKGSLRVASIPEKNLTAIYDSNGIVRECSMSFRERFAKAFVNELQEFVSCIIENRRPDVGAVDGVESIKVANACKESLIKGEKVTLN
jgi:myo-inositol 2-dehydrogenase / D-chiro-inositol 1-dehydrogenase